MKPEGTITLTAYQVNSLGENSTIQISGITDNFEIRIDVVRENAREGGNFVNVLLKDEVYTYEKVGNTTILKLTEYGAFYFKHLLLLSKGEFIIVNMIKVPEILTVDVTDKIRDRIGLGDIKDISVVDGRILIKYEAYKRREGPERNTTSILSDMYDWIKQYNTTDKDEV